MESTLSTWFELAERWGAVILIDEADVYLERRQLTDLKRNSLVSGRPFIPVIVNESLLLSQLVRAFIGSSMVR